MKEVEKIISLKSINRNGLFLFSKEDAKEFLNACKSENIEIIGIDGFWLKENKIIPSMENSIDFSSKHFINRQSAHEFFVNIYESAVSFLDSKSDEMFFEIIYK